jgi:predicted ribosome quality control (RQC) complex YloA/Tae2 family protein
MLICLQLQKKNQLLEQNINAKAGEVAIVRSKQEKEAKEHERELNALRKLSEEKLAKQRRELEAVRIAANNAATERDFVKQDLAESERVRKLNKAADKKDLNITPKKKKTLPHRDGFDDDEIQILSPSKVSPSKFRERNGTPTKAGKRKRKAIDSPAPALDVIQTETSFEEERKAAVFDEEIIARLGIQDDRFDVSVLPSIYYSS